MHGRDDSAFWRTFIRARQRTRFHNAGIQPLADQTQYPPITYPPLNKLSQKVSVYAIEVSTYIRIQYPSNVQPPALLPQFLQGLMLTVALPEAIPAHLAAPHNGCSATARADP